MGMPSTCALLVRHHRALAILSMSLSSLGETLRVTAIARRARQDKMKFGWFVAVAVVASCNGERIMREMTVEAPGDIVLSNWTSGRSRQFSYTRVVPCIDPRLTSIIVEKTLCPCGCRVRHHATIDNFARS